MSRRFEILLILVSLLCASGCKSFMKPNFFDTRKYSYAEVYYQDDFKMVSSKADGFIETPKDKPYVRDYRLMFSI